MAPLIFLAGHSFVKRLASDRKRVGDTTLSFNLRDHFSLFMQGYSGASVASLRSEIVPFIWDLRPTHVIIDIGTNDLAPRDAHPVQVGDAIVALAREISELPYVRGVVMLGIIPRKPPTTGRYRRRTRPDFNDVFQVANDQLRFAAQSSDELLYWPQRGLYADPSSFLSSDGTHLNTEGMRKYTRNVRNAIIKCMSI